MVRKIICLLLVLVALLAVPIATSAATYIPPYKGTFNVQIVEIVADMVQKNMKFNEHYVFIRDSETSYMLFIGDITYYDSLPDYFHMSEGKVIILNINPIPYTIQVLERTDFNIIANGTLVYSDLGAYPDLIERTNYYEVATLILLLVFICIYILRSIFNFCIRRRY